PISAVAPQAALHCACASRQLDTLASPNISACTSPPAAASAMSADVTAPCATTWTMDEAVTAAFGMLIVDVHCTGAGRPAPDQKKDSAPPSASLASTSICT